MKLSFRWLPTSWQGADPGLWENLPLIVEGFPALKRGPKKGASVPSKRSEVPIGRFRIDMVT